MSFRARRRKQARYSPSKIGLAHYLADRYGWSHATALDAVQATFEYIRSTALNGVPFVAHRFGTFSRRLVQAGSKTGAVTVGVPEQWVLKFKRSRNYGSALTEGDDE